MTKNHVVLQLIVALGVVVWGCQLKILPEGIQQEFTRAFNSIPAYPQGHELKRQFKYDDNEPYLEVIVSAPGYQWYSDDFRNNFVGGGWTYQRTVGELGLHAYAKDNWLLNVRKGPKNGQFTMEVMRRLRLSSSLRVLPEATMLKSSDRGVGL